jgi:ankyrin repeat protein
MKHLLLTTIAAVLLVGTVFADPIHDAVNRGDLAGVQAELDKGANVNAKMWRRTPLHSATAGGHTEIAELLIDNGADVNANEDYGWTPLHLAAKYGHREVAELLIAKGADVNAKKKDGWTPLHLAALYGHTEIVELLITNGADVNAKTEEGATPLHEAAGWGHKEIVELLIARGVDVNAKNDLSFTPLDWAASVDEEDPPEIKAAKREISDFLRKHGGKTGAELKALMPRLVQHGRFAFSFVAKEGKVYEVQDSFDLLNWEVIKTYTGTGTAVRFDEERDHDPPKWFYRVRVVE